MPKGASKIEETLHNYIKQLSDPKTKEKFKILTEYKGFLFDPKSFFDLD
jgi:hypothetical protein